MDYVNFWWLYCEDVFSCPEMDKKIKSLHLKSIASFNFSWLSNACEIKGRTSRFPLDLSQSSAFYCFLLVAYENVLLHILVMDFKRRLFEDGRAPTSMCPQELSWHESWDWRQPQKLVLFLFQGPRVASCLEVERFSWAGGWSTWCLTFSSCWNTSYYSQAALCPGPRHSLPVSSEAVINTMLCIYILRINCGSTPELKHLAKL